MIDCGAIDGYEPWNPPQKPVIYTVFRYCESWILCGI